MSNDGESGSGDGDAVGALEEIEGNAAALLANGLEGLPIGESESGALELTQKISQGTLREARGGDGGFDDYERRDASARADKLVREARTRAEHQLAARSTMLDLMEALQLMQSQRRDLERLLALEKAKLPMLQARVKSLEEQLEEALEAEEKRQAEELVKKAMSSGNNVVFNMLLSKSRDGFESSFDRVVIQEAASDEEEETERGGSTTAPPDSRPTTSWSKDSKESELPEPKGPRPTSLGELVSAGPVGDRVTLKWAMRLWSREAEGTRAERRAQAEEAARQRAESERLRLLEIAREEGRAEVRKEMVEVERKLKQERERNKELEAKIKELQVQIERLRSQLESRDPRYRQKSEEELAAEAAEYADGRPPTAGQDPQFITRTAENAHIYDEMRRRQLEYEREKKALHNTIKSLQEDLQQAALLAKYLRESALKAKREAANSVSPARFGDLISALEAMRERLSAMERDAAHQRDSNDWLKRQMEANKRHMELERQFLPLLRQAKGPLGAKDKVRSVKDLRDPPWIVEEQQPQGASVLARRIGKMGSSQSVGALNGRGGPLQGAL